MSQKSTIATKDCEKAWIDLVRRMVDANEFAVPRAADDKTFVQIPWARWVEIDQFIRTVARTQCVDIIGCPQGQPCLNQSANVSTNRSDATTSSPFPIPDNVTGFLREIGCTPFDAWTPPDVQRIYMIALGLESTRSASASANVPASAPLPAIEDESYPYRLHDGDIRDAQGRRITVAGNLGIAQLLNTIVELRRDLAYAASRSHDEIEADRAMTRALALSETPSATASTGTGLTAHEADVIAAAVHLTPLLEEGWDDQDTPEDRNEGARACDALVAAVNRMLGKEVYCHECSKAGGAERGIYHTPPVCTADSSASKEKPNE